MMPNSGALAATAVERCISTERQLAEACTLLAETRDELLSTLDCMLVRGDSLEHTVRSSEALFEGSLQFRLTAATTAVAPWWRRIVPVCCTEHWLRAARHLRRVRTTLERRWQRRQQQVVEIPDCYEARDAAAATTDLNHGSRSTTHSAHLSQQQQQQSATGASRTTTIERLAAFTEWFRNWQPVEDTAP